jgi:hypothetical protein
VHGIKRRGDPEDEARLDIGRAGEHHDDRVAKKSCRRTGSGDLRARESAASPEEGQCRAEQGGNRHRQLRPEIPGEEVGEGHQQLVELRKDRRAQIRHEGRRARAHEAADIRQVVEGGVEGGRRVQRQQDERERRGGKRHGAEDDLGGSLPAGAPEARCHPARLPPGLSPDRPPQPIQDEKAAGDRRWPQGTRESRGERQMSQGGEPHRRRHHSPLEDASELDPPRQQTAGHVAAHDQRRDGRHHHDQIGIPRRHDAPESSPPCCRLSSALEEMHEPHDDGDDEHEVNEAARDMECEEAQGPQHQQDHSDCQQHR